MNAHEFDYRALYRNLVGALCPIDDFPPCDECSAAAYRIIAHRRAIRMILVDFAEREGDLPCASTSARGQACCTEVRGHSGPHQQWVMPDFDEAIYEKAKPWLYAEWEDDDAD